MPRLTPRREPLALVHPMSAVAEAFRGLRTNLEFANRSGQLKVVLVTSAGPGEGKSAVCAHLAAAFAQANRNVLLIDADLRTPAQHRLFGLPNHIGLSTVLSGQGDCREAIRKTETGSLQVLGSGPIPPNPSELLDSPSMDALLQSVKERFDFVIVDAPAILPVTDARIMAGKCDGVLLVVQAGKTKREAVRKAKAALEYGQAPIVGTVLNRAGR